MTIYSTQFFAGVLPPNGTTIFTVPATQIAVVRDIEFYNGSGAPGGCSVQLRVSGSLVAVIFQVQSMQTDTWTQWTGRVVAKGSEAISSGAGATNFFCVVSGYLFDS